MYEHRKLPTPVRGWERAPQPSRETERRPVSPLPRLAAMDSPYPFEYTGQAPSPFQAQVRGPYTSNIGTRYELGRPSGSNRDFTEPRDERRYRMSNPVSPGQEDTGSNFLVFNQPPLTVGEMQAKEKDKLDRARRQNREHCRKTWSKLSGEEKKRRSRKCADRMRERRKKWGEDAERQYREKEKARHREYRKRNKWKR